MYKILFVVLSLLVLITQARDTLVSNGDNTLLSSSSLISPNNITKLTINNDGYVIFSNIHSGRVYWSAKTLAGSEGVAPFQLTLQNDGNVILSDAKSRIFWSSNSGNNNAGCAPYSLTVRDDPISLNVADCAGARVWTANVQVGGVSTNNHKRSNTCYEVLTTCTNVYGFSGAQIVLIAGIVQDQTTLSGVFTTLESNLGLTLSVFSISGGFGWYSEYRHAATCTCDVTGGIEYVIINQ